MVALTPKLYVAILGYTPLPWFSVLDLSSPLSGSRPSHLVKVKASWALTYNLMFLMLFPIPGNVYPNCLLLILSYGLFPRRTPLREAFELFPLHSLGKRAFGLDSVQRLSAYSLRRVPKELLSPST